METFKYIHIRTLLSIRKCYFEQKQNWRIERTEADMSNSNKAQTMLTLELVDATPAPLIAIH